MKQVPCLIDNTIWNIHQQSENSEITVDMKTHKSRIYYIQPFNFSRDFISNVAIYISSTYQEFSKTNNFSPFLFEVTWLNLTDKSSSSSSSDKSLIWQILLSVALSPMLFFVLLVIDVGNRLLKSDSGGNVCDVLKHFDSKFLPLHNTMILELLVDCSDWSVWI